MPRLTVASLPESQPPDEFNFTLDRIPIITTMASLCLQSLLLASAFLISPSIAAQALDTQLVGTWSTKSAKVLTGPVCFYSWNRPAKKSHEDENCILTCGGDRASITQSTIVLSSLAIQESQFRSPQMGIMRKRITGQSQIVRQHEGEKRRNGNANTE